MCYLSVFYQRVAWSLFNLTQKSLQIELIKFTWSNYTWCEVLHETYNFVHHMLLAIKKIGIKKIGKFLFAKDNFDWVINYPTAC